MQTTNTTKRRKKLQLNMEVHCINEFSDYLKQLVHEIGYTLRSAAVCTHVHRIRYGAFTLDHALLRSQWNVGDIYANINMCRGPLRQNLVTAPVVSVGDIAEMTEDSLQVQPGDLTTEDMIKLIYKRETLDRT